MSNQSICILYKAIIILSLSIITLTLSAQPVTIIDTVYTENSLQGAIGHIMETNMYYAEILPEYASDIGPGDYYVSTGDNTSSFRDKYIFNREMVNGGVRYYLSFPIQDIPRNYLIENVRFMLYQFFCHSNGGDDRYPLFYDNRYGCMIDHVNYGNSLEIIDFNPINYGIIGAISNDSLDGWKQLDVTDAYQQDVNRNAQYIQFMIYFPIVSDWDNCADFIWFGSSYYPDITGFPQLVITYRSLTVCEDNYNASIPLVSIYPNPCHDKATISVNDNFSIQEVNLYNIKGQKVKTKDINSKQSNSVSIEFKENLKPGLYVLIYITKSEGKNYLGSRKIIIK